MNQPQEKIFRELAEGNRPDLIRDKYKEDCTQEEITEVINKFIENQKEKSPIQLAIESSGLLNSRDELIEMDKKILEESKLKPIRVPDLIDKDILVNFNGQEFVGRYVSQDHAAAALSLKCVELLKEPMESLHRFTWKKLNTFELVLKNKTKFYGKYTLAH
jgi:hypothetical protein